MKTIEHNGTEHRVTIERDNFMYAPWEENDGHGIVSDWEHRDKAPGELVLCSDRGGKRFYDFEESVKIARRDGWGSAGDEGLTAGAKAAKATRADFEYLRDWCEDRWLYATVDDGKNGYIDECIIPELLNWIEDQHQYKAA